MRIETQNPANVIQISDVEKLGLDPITVITQDFEPGCGRVIVECYGMAWAAYWGSMPDHRTVIKFMASMDSTYLMNKLSRPNQTRKDDLYLGRIVAAIVNALNPIQA